MTRIQASHPPAAHAARKKSDAVKLAICGIGRAGMGMIYPEVKDLPEIRVVAGYDELPERARRLAQLSGGRAHRTFKLLLSDPEVETVVIATRSHTHAVLALQALKAGKDVIVEKPMAITLRDADNMIGAAAKLGRRLLVRHNRRFDLPLLQAKEVIAGGKLGKIFEVQLRQ